MNVLLSRNDVVQIAIHALASFVLGGAFALGNALSHKKIGDKLLVDTRVLQSADNTMFVLLHELQNQITDTSDRIVVIRLIGAIDRVLEREVKLEHDRINIHPQTRVDCEADYATIKNNYFGRLQASFGEQHKNDTKLIEDFTGLCVVILTRVYKHLERIWILTEKSRQIKA